MEERERDGQAPNIGPVERAARVVGGTALVTAGLGRRSMPGALIAAGGAWLLYSGATGRSALYRRLGMATTSEAYHDGIIVRRAMTVRRPAAEIYERLRDFEGLPRMLGRGGSVESLGDGGYRWRLRDGTSMLECILDLVEDQPERQIAWVTRPGSRLRCDGTIRMQSAPGDRGTEVHAELRVALPGGPTTMMLTPVVRRLVDYQLAESFHRFKQLLETGEITTSRMQPERQLGRRPEAAELPAREMEVMQ